MIIDRFKLFVVFSIILVVSNDKKGIQVFNDFSYFQ